MSAISVFYAWQSDLPRKTTRDFLEEAARLALERVGSDATLEDSPRLDRDTLGISGLPDISGTIYRKIEQSAVFLADVSLVGQTMQEDPNKKRKLLPNPNVLLELGYAAAKLGWDRIILAMNKEHGQPEELPFDLRNRRFPTSFRLSPDQKNREKKLESLSADIEGAIRDCLNSEYDRVADTVAKFDMVTIDLIRTRGCSPEFWHTEPDKNKLVSHHDLAISRLLDLGLIRCVRFTNEFGYAYRWTYFGRQCIRHLGFKGPLVSLPITDGAVIAPGVISDMSVYDLLDGALQEDESEQPELECRPLGIDRG